MPLSPSRKEMLWVEAWSDLIEMDRETKGLIILGPDWRRLTLEEAQGKIQDQAYLDFRTVFEPTYFTGRPAVRLAFQPIEEP